MMCRKAEFKSCLACICLLLLAACGSEGVSDIQVIQAWVRPVMVAMPEHHMNGMKNDTVTAVYLTIENHGAVPDRLISVSTDAAASAEIHKSQIDERGMLQMQPQPEGIEIPVNSTVLIEPGGYHIMLSGLRKTLEIGETISLNLEFESGLSMMFGVEVSDEPPED